MKKSGLSDFFFRREVDAEAPLPYRHLFGRRHFVLLYLQIVVDVTQAAILDEQGPAAELAAAAR